MYPSLARPLLRVSYVFRTIWRDIVRLFAMLSVNVRENRAAKQYLKGKYKPKSQRLGMCKILDECGNLSQKMRANR